MISAGQNCSLIHFLSIAICFELHGAFNEIQNMKKRRGNKTNKSRLTTRTKRGHKRVSEVVITLFCLHSSSSSLWSCSSLCLCTIWNVNTEHWTPNNEQLDNNVIAIIFLVWCFELMWPWAPKNTKIASEKSDLVWFMRRRLTSAKNESVEVWQCTVAIVYVILFDSSWNHGSAMAV